jgi:hypothetical protein
MFQKSALQPARIPRVPLFKVTQYGQFPVPIRSTF